MLPKSDLSTSLSKYLALAKSPDLTELLYARLIELAFTQHTQVAINAIEMLREWGQDIPRSDLSSIPTDKLKAIRTKAEEIIVREAGMGARENGLEN